MGEVDVVHGPVFDAVGPFRVRLEHHGVVLVPLEGDGPVGPFQVLPAELGGGRASQVERDTEFTEALFGVPGNQGGFVGHQGGQEATGEGPGGVSHAGGVPVEKGLSMAATVEVPRADEEGEGARICACALGHAG